MSELDAAFQELLNTYQNAPEMLNFELDIIAKDFKFPDLATVTAYFEQWLDDEIAGIHA